MQSINFNSIKVQLELGLCGMGNYKWIFQFHKGTIRTFMQSIMVNRKFDFNSIKVQLEQNGKRRLQTDLKFQFHKGTIRT